MRGAGQRNNYLYKELTQSERCRRLFREAITGRHEGDTFTVSRPFLF